MSKKDLEKRKEGAKAREKNETYERSMEEKKKTKKEMSVKTKQIQN